MEGEKKDSLVKEHFWDICELFKTWSCYILSKGTGNKCEDRKTTSIIVGLIFLGLSASGVWHSFIAPFLPNNEKDVALNTNPQPANAYATLPEIRIVPPKNTVKEQSFGCNLSQGNWSRWFGKINQDFENKSHFTLPANSAGALFKYIGKIDDFTTCEFEFIPISEVSINYVISLDEIYQVVIGDNDFWTITMRASDSVEGDMLPIKEESTGKTRPRLLNSIKNGTAVKVTLCQKFLDDGKYHVEVDIIYKPDTFTAETTTEHFSWKFEPSPLILDSPELSIGLIRSEGDDSEIGINFVKPEIDHQPDKVESIGSIETNQ